MTRRATERPQSMNVPPDGSTSVPSPLSTANPPGGTLRDLIREADTDRTVEEVELAREVLGALHRLGQLDLLLPILADEIRRVRRHRTARIERATIGSRAEGAEGGWLRLLPEGFVLPDGRWVTWGEASVEDHEARIGWLQGQMEALGEDVDRHQQAIKVIREHGVSCLAEVEAAA